MLWKLLALGAVLSFGHSASAQRDCVGVDSAYVYVLSVERVEAPDSFEVEILVPSYRALEFEEVSAPIIGFDRVVVGARQRRVEAYFPFYWGMTACGSPRSVMNHNMIGRKWGYTFWIRTLDGMQPRSIEMDDLSFEIEEPSGRIIITVPPFSI